MQLLTKRGYEFGPCVSATQKAIRRGEADIAGYFALELAESGYHAYLWKRLLIISAEDCAGIITQEVIALHDAFLRINEGPKQDKLRGKVCIAKAILLLCQARKNRDADHLVCLVPTLTAAEKFEKALESAREDGAKIELPEYTFDVHTRRGRARGQTKRDFFRAEFLALHPREQGEFDWTCEQEQLDRLAPQHNPPR